MVHLHLTYRETHTVTRDNPSGGGTIQVAKTEPGRTLNITARWAHLRDGCVVYGQTSHHEREEIIPLGQLWSLVIDRTGDASAPTA